MKHTFFDYYLFAKSQLIRILLRGVYRGQVEDEGIRVVHSFPVVRYANGRVVIGRGARIRGSVLVDFEPEGPPGLVRIGELFITEGDLSLFSRGGLIEIGSNCFIGRGTLVQTMVGHSVVIGRDVMIANGVTIVATDHGLDPDCIMRTQPERGANIEIGPDVWIGANAVVLKGVRIGAGAVVASSAVVRHDVAPYSIVAGVPAVQVSTRLRDSALPAGTRSAT